MPQPSLWVMGLSVGIDTAFAGSSCVILARALQTLFNLPTRKGGIMNTVKRRLFAEGALAALALAALATVGNRTAVHAADDEEVEYTFGRPVKDGEQTYDWYRKTHVDWAAKRYGVDPKAVGDGMDTWHWWCGVDNPGFWREQAKLTSKKKDGVAAQIDLLRMLHAVPRSERWEKIGLVNDPDCVPAEKPDQYGLRIDRMKDGTLTWDPDVFGFSSGVVGLQLFKNKNFDAKKWSIDKYLDDASSVEPPYLVGMACTLCHTAFNPNRPPINPAEPKWENMDSHIGSQYFREGMLFGFDMPKDNFAWQYLHNQSPGTSETTRFPADFINNPVLINSIYRLNDRLKLGHADRISPEQKVMMQSINKHVGLPENDGHRRNRRRADVPCPESPVPRGRLDGPGGRRNPRLRQRGVRLQGLVPDLGPEPVRPQGERGTRLQAKGVRHLGKVRKDPKSPWMQTEVRMPNMALYLSTHDGFPLKDAIEAEGKGGKNGKDYLTTDADVLRKGKIAFADSCARCHSSKKPDNLPGTSQDAEGSKEGLARLGAAGRFPHGTTSCPTTNATPPRSWVRTSRGP